MTITELPSIFQKEDFTKEGLYLLFPDGQKVKIVRDEIEALSEEFWQDPKKIHPNIKEMPEFQPCGHCPHHGEDILCLALRPILPYLKNVDRYMSYQEVTAVFSAGDASNVKVSKTTTQQALKYVAILSLIYYCEMGNRYCGFLKDISPLTPPKEMADHLLSNIKEIYGEDKAKINEEIAKFQKEVLESAQCLTKRLRLICENDAFLNAFVNAQTALDFLLLKNRKQSAG
ncbi:MAG: hypothetical protein WC676_05960 [Candidatus Omnitrophota bacterium]